MATAEGYAHPEYLAETQWLADHLTDPGICIVDTDPVASYQRAHIPGAVVVPDNYEKDPDTGQVNVVSPEQCAKMMAGLGIDDDTLVVTYDHSRSLYAGRLWWVLNYYGHDKVKVLNGGWKKWLEEGRPLSTTPSRGREGATFTPRPDPSLLVTTERLKESYQDPDVVVWDVRTLAEYTGENTRGNRRAGHIAGAHHLEWSELMDESTHTFKPAPEMREILEAKGIVPEKEVLAH